jgi:drug/metabolite transporter (DMT)-like permease
MAGILESGELWAVLSAVFWSFAVILFKPIGERVPPLALNLFKNTMAFLCFIPFVVFREAEALAGLQWRELAILVASGFLGITVTDTLFFSALNRLGAGLQAVVDCLYWPAMLLFAWALAGEPVPGLIVLCGGILVIVGILIGAESRPLPGHTRRDLLVGAVFATLAMVLLAISVAIMKPLLTPDRVFSVLTIRILVGTVFLIPAVSYRREWRAAAAIFRPSRLWRIAIPSCFLGGVLAMGCWIAGFVYTTVSAAAILNQLSPIMIFILSWLVLKEPLGRRRVAAILTALAGTGVIMAATG